VAARFATLHDIGGLNSRVTSLVRQELTSHLTEGFRPIYSIGDLQIWYVIVILLSVILLLGRKRWEAAILLAGFSVDLAVWLMKALETPVRMSGSLLTDLLAAANAGSFPSGHVARTAVTLGLLLAFLPGKSMLSMLWRIPAVLLVSGFLVLIGLVSIQFGAHTIGDILGAYLLAALWIVLLLLPRSVSASGRAALEYRGQAIREGPVENEL